jgi:hypothetical protein
LKVESQIPENKKQNPEKNIKAENGKSEKNDENSKMGVQS